MKAVIFSDIHGNQYAFREFLREIQQMDYQLLIFCGDIYGYYYGQDEIICQFQKMNSLHAVKGNHDELAIKIWEQVEKADQAVIQKYGHSYCQLQKESMAYLKKQPVEKELLIDGKRVLIIHGTIEDKLSGRLYPLDSVKKIDPYIEYDYILCGHTHYKMDRRVGNTLILNPGSLGQQRDGKGFGFLYLDFSTGFYEFRNIDLELKALEQEIDLYDPENKKLKEILHRGGY